MNNYAYAHELENVMESKREGTFVTCSYRPLKSTIEVKVYFKHDGERLRYDFEFNTEFTDEPVEKWADLILGQIDLDKPYMDELAAEARALRED